MDNLPRTTIFVANIFCGNTNGVGVDDYGCSGNYPDMDCRFHPVKYSRTRAVIRSRCFRSRWRGFARSLVFLFSGFKRVTACRQQYAFASTSDRRRITAGDTPDCLYTLWHRVKHPHTPNSGGMVSLSTVTDTEVFILGATVCTGTRTPPALVASHAE